MQFVKGVGVDEFFSRAKSTKVKSGTVMFDITAKLPDGSEIKVDNVLIRTIFPEMGDELVNEYQATTFDKDFNITHTGGVTTSVKKYVPPKKKTRRIDVPKMNAE